MLKDLRSKIILSSVTLLVLIAVISIPLLVFSNDHYSERPEEAIEMALNAALDGDAENFSKLVVDDRYSNLEEQIKSNEMIFERINLVDYRLLTLMERAEGDFQATVEMTYQNGAVYETKIYAEEFNNGWKVVTRELEPEDTRVIKEAD